MKAKQKPELGLPQPMADWSFEAIGTHWWIGVYEPVGSNALADMRRAVAERIEAFDKTYSWFRADSLVSRIAAEKGRYVFPEDSGTLFALYRALYDATDGAVTPLIGQLLSDAGYDAAYSLKPGALHEVPAWDDVMTYRDGELTTKEPVLLDFGAAGKGYLVDIIANELQSAGVDRFCVDAGGDMVCRGLARSLRIGLEHPDDTAQVIGVVEVQDGALCGSAGNRRAWAGYHHVMDPRTLESARDVKAVWVSAADGLTADGLATALFFTTPAELLNRFKFEYVIIAADDSVAVSPDFPGKLFTESAH
ncbi:MAG: FAD:protein FMN transferase [Candidatus Saccharibacteria bacterium]